VCSALKFESVAHIERRAQVDAPADLAVVADAAVEHVDVAVPLPAALVRAAALGEQVDVRRV
jgi:hypothetical protein